jgi:hypothetical protein
LPMPVPTTVFRVDARSARCWLMVVVMVSPG